EIFSGVKTGQNQSVLQTVPVGDFGVLAPPLAGPLCRSEPRKDAFSRDGYGRIALVAVFVGDAHSAMWNHSVRAGPPITHRMRAATWPRGPLPLASYFLASPYDQNHPDGCSPVFDVI